MRVKYISPLFVDYIPERLEYGVLYVCEQYRTAAHMCCCGCGEEVITPLTPAEWSIKKEGDTVSLSPSIGNWSYKCKSHYCIRRNRVVWAGNMSERQINRVKERDRADLEAYIDAINQQKGAKERDRADTEAYIDAINQQKGAKERGRADTEAYIDAINQKKGKQQKQSSMLAWLWQKLVRWLKSK
jgi:hypothetical protein